MSKYIAIYHDGSYALKRDLESVFSFPGEYFVFSFPENGDLISFNKVQFYDKDKKQQNFRVDNWELLNVLISNHEYNKNNILFKIYDPNSGTVREIDSNCKYFPEALSFIVITMDTASQLPNWETYEDLKKIEEYKSEIRQLKEQVETLKRERRTDK